MNDTKGDRLLRINRCCPARLHANGRSTQFITAKQRCRVRMDPGGRELGAPIHVQACPLQEPISQ